MEKSAYNAAFHLHLPLGGSRLLCYNGKEKTSSVDFKGWFCMLGFAILLGFHLVGTGLHALLHLPLPGNVIGLILFLISLGFGWVKLEWVEQSAQFLLDHMLLFFIPYVVGVIAFLPVLESHGWSIAAGIVGSTLLVLWVTGFTAAKLQKPVQKPTRQEVGVNGKEETA